MKDSLKFSISLIKQYSFKSVFFQYAKKFLLMITIPFLFLFFCVYFYYSKVNSNEIRYTMDKSFTTAIFNAQNMFGEFEKNFILYSTDPYVNIFLNTSQVEHSFRASDYAPNINKQMNRTVNSSSVLASISIYSAKSNYIMSSASSSYADKATDDSWLKYHRDTGLTDFSVMARSYITYSDSFFTSYGIYDGQEFLGLIVFEVLPGTINKNFTFLHMSDTDHFFLTDKNLNTIYSSKENPRVSLEDDIKTKFLNHISDNPYERFSHTEKGISYTAETTNTNGTIYLLYEIKHKTSTTINFLFLATILLTIFVPLMLAVYISLKFHRSLTDIISLLNITDSNQNESKDEFDYIANNIINLVKDRENIEAKLVTHTAAFKKAQLSALQTQFSPHFLFNTLQAISLNARVLLKGDNPVTQSISLLSKLLTIALNTQTYVVTVAEEIDYTKTYLDIQLMRYKNKVDIKWDIAPDANSCKTIKFVLQPLIENVFQHGITQLENRRGKITISAKLHQDTLILRVTDNGKQILPERLAEIRNNLETKDMAERHIGLININQRLKLIYDDAILTIESDENSTSVTITQPQHML